MTRRIAIAILTIVWLILLSAGVSTYIITRAILFNDLDDTIISRVSSLPEIERPAFLPHSTPDSGDRYVIQDDQGARISSGIAPRGTVAPPEIMTRASSRLADGSGLLTLTIRAYAHRESPIEGLRPVTVVYSISTAPVDELLRKLLYSLGGFGMVAALATAVVAHSAARAVLRPMRDTAEVIGAIDERSLDRRIDVGRLPVELAPVGRKLNDMLGRLQNAFTAHRQFMADASHELRTPVAAIVTTLEVALRRKRDAGEYAQILDSCLNDARLLNKLVVALLDQVRQQRFAAEVDLAPVSITEVLNQCVNVVAPLAGAKNIHIERDIPANLVVLSDEQKLRSIVTNLIANAVEYTLAGGAVSVSARWSEASSAVLPAALATAVPEGVTATPRELIIRVTDTGPGISPQHLPNLFEPFYRADAARTNSDHHLGLGLAIVRTNSRALGGDCSVKSPASLEKRGCEFTITLPTVDLYSVVADAVRVSPRSLQAAVVD